MATQLVRGNNAISIDSAGWVLFKRPHGTFYSIVTQTIVSATADPPLIIAFENEVDNEGLTHSNATNNSRIYVPTSGSYEICISGIADTTAGSAKYMEIWLRVDGTNVSNSNTRIELTGTTETTVAVSFIYDLNAGQYVELASWGTDNTCRWLFTEAVAAEGGVTPARPACPSMIMTVKKISSKLSYE
jgi:hypothetical protein